MSFGIQPLGLLAALLAAACASDAARRRVPNAISVAVAVLGVLAQGSASGARAAALGAGAMAAVLVVLAVPWLSGVLGGGDVKLAAACAAWTGFHRLPLFALATALAGGALATALVVWHRRTIFTPGWMSPPVGMGKVRIPYAFAIGAGALAALTWRIP